MNKQKKTKRHKDGGAFQRASLGSEKCKAHRIHKWLKVYGDEVGAGEEGGG
jgi:hypothetical protein